MWNIFKKNKLPSLTDQYVEIMNEFNFKRVHEFMNWPESSWSYNDDGSYEKNQWEMITKDGSYRVPSEYDLRLLASKLLLEVMRSKEKCHSIRTGPFKVTKRYGILELECIIEHWSYD